MRTQADYDRAREFFEITKPDASAVFSVTLDDVRKAGMCELDIARMVRQGFNYDRMLEILEAEQSTLALYQGVA